MLIIADSLLLNVDDVLRLVAQFSGLIGTRDLLSTSYANFAISFFLPRLQIHPLYLR